MSKFFSVRIGLIMNELRSWHKPSFRLLDARATALNGDDTLSDPGNFSGDLPENSETASSFGAPHNQADSGSE
jgi:hypothetical protein